MVEALHSSSYALPSGPIALWCPPASGRDGGAAGRDGLDRREVAALHVDGREVDLGELHEIEGMGGRAQFN